ncbi:50S ribosomal protein L25/general stress protein Ctc [Corynebacterium alimapuense]|uniref:Large ribosomal subunit protein bL25 n=1 Tax=Corynebacterium alimapuense TaxID=1576874 RepID=A0A3M8K716_9CORY|nr:50S ribosomal protein L25/general stress protein Ctc [Corynebacterium alimapuense]RNE48555.1 50S ribosomal protein L25 [Corynebacterium alimapuense]
MAKYPTLTATLREEFGKGFARRLRSAGRIPGVIYSGHTENVHFSVDRLEYTAVIRNNGVNSIIEFDIDGEKHLTMVKHIDQNVLTFKIDHVDMLAINRNERVEVDVPILLEGEPVSGAMVIQDADTIYVEANVLEIPEEIVVSIEGLDFDARLYASDVVLPEDVTLVADPESIVVSIHHPEAEEEEEAPAEEAAAESTESDES